MKTKLTIAVAFGMTLLGGCATYTNDYPGYGYDYGYYGAWGYEGGGGRGHYGRGGGGRSEPGNEAGMYPGRSSDGRGGGGGGGSRGGEAGSR